MSDYNGLQVPALQSNPRSRIGSSSKSESTPDMVGKSINPFGAIGPETIDIKAISEASDGGRKVSQHLSANDQQMGN